MAIKAILFDLGNTLINFETRPPAELHRDAEAAVRDRLMEIAGPEKIPNTEDFRLLVSRAWRTAEDRCRRAAGQSSVEEAIRIILERLAFDDSAATVRALVLAHYQVFRAQIRAYPEVKNVLETLRKRGMALALISNTIWPAVLHREDLSRFGLDTFFQHMVFSTEFGRMKPHPSIFRNVLDELGVSPAEAVMVGDQLEADILGARKVGCRAVLRIHPFANPDPRVGMRPDAEIDSLSEILPLLDRWNGGVADEGE